MPTKQTSHKNKGRAQVVGQWIEITVVDGVTHTTRYPSDQEMLAVIAKKEKAIGRPIDLLYRRLNFVNGVPPEYLWTTADPRQIQFGGLATQRLRVENWKELVDEEQGGHLIASSFHMPRPESRGGCDCPACRAFTARLETGAS